MISIHSKDRKASEPFALDSGVAIPMTRRVQLEWRSISDHVTSATIRAPPKHARGRAVSGSTTLSDDARLDECADDARSSIASLSLSLKGSD
jgi:hypothetical protein